MCGFVGFINKNNKNNYDFNLNLIKNEFYTPAQGTKFRRFMVRW